MNIFVFFLSYAVWSFSDWWLRYRKPMKCLKTLDFDCDHCRVWTCPRYCRGEMK